MTKGKPLPKLGRCPYCGHKLTLYHVFGGWTRTGCWNARCAVNRLYATDRGALNAANRRAK